MGLRQLFECDMPDATAADNAADCDFGARSHSQREAFALVVP
ncbi:hypothetical protein NY08_1834 [Rhodococcus sp. B7740]|nr:hypothetical protein NY08_1834 [Rhodococcus sp. B7740]